MIALKVNRDQVRVGDLYYGDPIIAVGIQDHRKPDKLGFTFQVGARTLIAWMGVEDEIEVERANG